MQKQNEDPTKTMARMVLQLFGITLSLYILAVGVMYFKQHDFLYLADTTAPGTPAENEVPNMKVVEVETEDGLKLFGWFVPPKKKNGKIIVMFHGSEGNIKHRAIKSTVFDREGYGVYIAEYRGYGGNPGVPNEEGLYKDGRAVIKWLDGKGYFHDQYVLYGDSIGSGVAVQMALEYQIKLMVLEAPFTNLPEAAGARFSWAMPGLLMKEKFDNYEKISKINPALLIIQGDSDPITPPRLAKKLFAAANEPKSIMILKGASHADLFNFGAGQIIVGWLKFQESKEKK
ncbi:MAG: alpha/beta hydrolase [Alphaproteobacteria bacterium]